MFDWVPEPETWTVGLLIIGSMNQKNECFGDLLTTDVFGVLEYWGGGVMVQGMIFYNTPILHFSSTPANLIQ